MNETGEKLEVFFPHWAPSFFERSSCKTRVIVLEKPGLAPWLFFYPNSSFSLCYWPLCNRRCYKFLMFLTIFVSLVFSLQAWSSILIENGRFATEEELQVTGTVAIVYEENNAEKSSCTGVRIAPHLVLTASHCIYHPLKFPIGIRQALNPLDQSVKLEKVKALKFPFENFYYRKNFEAGYLLDIALLILEEDSSAFYPRISQVELNETFLQLGYGMDFHIPTKPVYPLSLLENGVLDLEDATSPFSFTLRNDGSSPRSGDSGGPVFMGDYSLVGILSSGNPRPLKDIKTGRAIYMSVYHFVEWIRFQSGLQDFASYLNLNHQFHEDSQELITRHNYREVHLRLCEEMSTNLGGTWYLTERGECLPRNEELCLKLKRGEINSTYFVVNWNPIANRCE